MKKVTNKLDGRNYKDFLHKLENNIEFTNDEVDHLVHFGFLDNFYEVDKTKYTRSYPNVPFIYPFPKEKPIIETIEIDNRKFEILWYRSKPNPPNPSNRYTEDEFVKFDYVKEIKI